LSESAALTEAHFNRILIVRTDRLGDVILTLPLLPVVRKRYPDAYIGILLKMYTGEIVTGNPYVNEIIWYDDGRERVPFAAMVREIRRKKFDAVVVVSPTLRLALLMFLAGIPVRIATGYRYYSFLFNRRVYEHRKDARRHELEYNLRLLRELDCSPDGPPEFTIYMSEEDEESVRRMLLSRAIQPEDELVILHPGSGGSAREWPVRSFAELAGMFEERRRSKIIVTGIPGDEPKADAIVSGTRGAAVSMVGTLRVKQLAVLLRSADLLVANSTGPLHIAAAVGTPVVGLYPQITPMNATWWGPYGNRKRVLTPAKPEDCAECAPEKGEECACMASISAGQVFEAASELLTESAK